MRMLTRGLAVLMALWLAACATAPTIRSDYDRTADFSAFRSFGFADKLGTDVAGYSTLLTQRLKRAVTQELTQRGYVPAAQEPDLLVTFYSRIQDKVRVTPAPPLWGPYPYDYYGPYGSGMYRPWWGYGGYADVQSYSEGTLSIDLIDRKRRQMVWEGVAVSRALPDDDLPTEQAVDQIVHQIFAEFQFRAGGA
jgi:hypothetical protein